MTHPVHSLYVHCMFTIYSLYIHYILTICSFYTHYILIMYSLYVHYINKTNDLILNLTPENVTQHSRIVTTTRKVCSLYTHFIFTIYSLYTHYMFTTSSLSYLSNPSRISKIVMARLTCIFFSLTRYIYYLSDLEVRLQLHGAIIAPILLY